MRPNVFKAVVSHVFLRCRGKLMVRAERSLNKMRRCTYADVIQFSPTRTSLPRRATVWLRTPSAPGALVTACSRMHKHHKESRFTRSARTKARRLTLALVLPFFVPSRCATCRRPVSHFCGGVLKMKVYEVSNSMHLSTDSEYLRQQTPHLPHHPRNGTYGPRAKVAKWEEQKLESSQDRLCCTQQLATLSTWSDKISWAHHLMAEPDDFCATPSISW